MAFYWLSNCFAAVFSNQKLLKRIIELCIYLCNYQYIIYTLSHHPKKEKKKKKKKILHGRKKGPAK